MKKPTIVLCSSASFYKHVNEIAAELTARGFTAVVPKNARVMAQTGDYEVAHYKTWFEDDSDYHKKAEYMRTHFDEITKGDIVLVVNDEKHEQANYIGANVLMEISLGWYLHKPIYLFNDLPADSPFEEELRGMNVKPLHGVLASLNEDVTTA